MRATHRQGVATGAHTGGEPGQGRETAEELVERAVAAYLGGRDAEAEEGWIRAHERCLGDGDVPRAARCAFWLAFQLLNSGEMARGSGWLARAQRLLDEAGQDCVERGYLLLPAGIRAAMSGEGEKAYAVFQSAEEIARRFGDRDLAAFARHGQGRALIELGRSVDGVALLDEAMVAVIAGETSPIVSGSVYCSVIEACYEIFDLRRANEWTMALSRWCAAQGEIAQFRGQCLLRRAEVMQLHGAWRDAIDETERARDLLLQPPPRRAVGAAFYQRAELHRLRGELTAAEEEYRRASEWGRKPQPGLSQLRLAQGQVDAAAAMIRRALDETRDRGARARLLGAYVEIMLAANDPIAARAGADELSATATALDSPFLRAVAAAANGAVLLAEADPAAALETLYGACAVWHELEALHETARTRMLIGVASLAAGDRHNAAISFDAARQAFESLGATLDLKKLEQLAGRSESDSGGPLSSRQMEVLRLVATGKTNRAIAHTLRISEKTVARHVSNIFTKLGLPSRAAATAYAYERGLMSGSVARGPLGPTSRAAT